MRLDLSFRADDEAEARTAATDWIEAEPAVEHGRIVRVERERDTRWIVTVELAFWPSFEQGELGLSA